MTVQQRDGKICNVRLECRLPLTQPADNLRLRCVGELFRRIPVFYGIRHGSRTGLCFRLVSPDTAEFGGNFGKLLGRNRRGLIDQKQAGFGSVLGDLCFSEAHLVPQVGDFRLQPRCRIGIRRQFRTALNIEIRVAQWHLRLLRTVACWSTRS